MMKHWLKTVFCGFLVVMMISLCSSVAYAKNVDLVHNEADIVAAIKKMNSKEFNAQIVETAAQAKEYLQKNLCKNAAIVSDIDETILTNKGYYKKYGLFDPKKEADWFNSLSSEPIWPVVKLLKWAHENNVKIFLITGRSEKFRDVTVKNLQKFNIPFDGLYMKSESYNKPSVVNYKAGIRKKLSEEGHKVILTIGDQDSDLKGGYGKGFKLPNLFYIIQ